VRRLFRLAVPQRRAVGSYETSSTVSGQLYGSLCPSLSDTVARAFASATPGCNVPERVVNLADQVAALEGV
jgi:hypothetical protein